MAETTASAQLINAMPTPAAQAPPGSCARSDTSLVAVTAAPRLAALPNPASAMIMEYCPKPTVPSCRNSRGRATSAAAGPAPYSTSPQKEALPATCLLRNACIGKPVCRPRGRDPQATGTACCGCSRRKWP